MVIDNKTSVNGYALNPRMPRTKSWQVATRLSAFYLHCAGGTDARGCLSPCASMRFSVVLRPSREDAWQAGVHPYGMSDAAGSNRESYALGEPLLSAVENGLNALLMPRRRPPFGTIVNHG